MPGVVKVQTRGVMVLGSSTPLLPDNWSLQGRIPSQQVVLQESCRAHRLIHIAYFLTTLLESGLDVCASSQSHRNKGSLCV